VVRCAQRDARSWTFAIGALGVLWGCQSPPPRTSDPGEKRPAAAGASRVFDVALARYASFQSADPRGVARGVALREITDLVDMAITNDPVSPLFLSTRGELALEAEERDIGMAEDFFARSVEAGRNWPPGYIGLARCARLRGDASSARRWLDQGQDALRYLAEGGAQEDERAQGMLERTPRERRELMKDLLAQHDLWAADRRLDAGPQRERAMPRTRADIELERVLLESDGPSGEALAGVLAWDPDHGEARVRSAVAHFEAREYRPARDMLLPIVMEGRSRLGGRADVLFVCGASLTGVYLETGQARDAEDGLRVLDALVAKHPWHGEGRWMGMKLRGAVAMRTQDPRVAAQALRDLKEFERVLTAPAPESFVASEAMRREALQLRSVLESVAAGKGRTAP
jgi:hypothetical protein